MFRCCGHVTNTYLLHQRPRDGPRYRLYWCIYKETKEIRPLINFLSSLLYTRFARLTLVEGIKKQKVNKPTPDPIDSELNVPGTEVP